MGKGFERKAGKEIGEKDRNMDSRQGREKGLRKGKK
jgi:hypothetical protein